MPKEQLNPLKTESDTKHFKTSAGQLRSSKPKSRHHRFYLAAPPLICIERSHLYLTASTTQMGPLFGPHCDPQWPHSGGVSGVPFLRDRFEGWPSELCQRCRRLSYAFQEICLSTRSQVRVR